MEKTGAEHTDYMEIMGGLDRVSWLSTRLRGLSVESKRHT